MERPLYFLAFALLDSDCSTNVVYFQSVKIRSGKFYHTWCESLRIATRNNGITTPHQETPTSTLSSYVLRKESSVSSNSVVHVCAFTYTSLTLTALNQQVALYHGWTPFIIYRK